MTESKDRRAAMFEAGDIREWRGHDVVDSGGHKIGTLESVYVDTGTDQAAFATVTVGPGYLKVTHNKAQVKDAPSIDTDGVLPATDEEAIFKHYDLPYEPGAGGERRLARQ